MNDGNDGESDVGTKTRSLAERIGVAAAARELGLYAAQIYQWRSKAAHEGGVSDREHELREENA